MQFFIGFVFVIVFCRRRCRCTWRTAGSVLSAPEFERVFVTSAVAGSTCRSPTGRSTRSRNSRSSWKWSSSPCRYVKRPGLGLEIWGHVARGGEWRDYSPNKWYVGGLCFKVTIFSTSNNCELLSKTVRLWPTKHITETALWKIYCYFVTLCIFAALS